MITLIACNFTTKFSPFDFVQPIQSFYTFICSNLVHCYSRTLLCYLNFTYEGFIHHVVTLSLCLSKLSDNKSDQSNAGITGTAKTRME
uniref:Uncharacterized protein n=1 Tax=Anguilla anguilla TaxID=7936 RepID=A0A0E9PE19_ANGAN